MSNIYLPDKELKRLKKLARASGYKIKRGPGSEIGKFIVRLMNEFEGPNTLSNQTTEYLCPSDDVSFYCPIHGAAAHAGQNDKIGSRRTS